MLNYAEIFGIICYKNFGENSFIFPASINFQAISIDKKLNFLDRE